MTPTDHPDLRPEIALGWRRSEMSGLDPGMEVRESQLFDVDRHSRLLRAAQPVLTSMVSELNDTRFSVLLADHSAKIVDRRLSNRSLHRHLDQVKAIPGAQYLEEFSGTNSLATAFELRKPIAVAGDEHYLEALRVFCCYGAPIIHPITRRLEGVLDVTGPVADQSDLLGPFLMRAVRDIGQRLQEGSKLSEQRLFAEFQAESARSKSAIVLFGENLALSNAAAMDLISSEDNALLRTLAGELGNTGTELVRSVALTSGREVDIRARLVAQSRDGVIIEVVPHKSARMTSSAPAAPVLRGRVVSVVGAPGTGKTTRAGEIAGPDAVLVDLAVDVPDSTWKAAVTRWARDASALVVDNLHLADTTTAAFLRSALRAASGTVVLVSSLDDLPDDHRALLACADEQEELPLLRDRGTSFPTTVQRLVAAIAADRDPSRRVRVTPSAMAVLATQDWPGNLTELDKVLRTALGRALGDVTVEDLPPRYRLQPSRTTTPLERAERATIVAVLAETGGNKAAAAAALGIGRNTLYQRLRYHHIEA
ncbi:hypothetical protein HH308_21425 [Gordonia sp. TBRC 11910]|uniref:Sigma-54 factor interaction domain-containing protein n=1 Tax=Gordonia asplenii TaxID=2725283 RepID=A0A848KYL2_9ACTN|nr:helix-turn-helix domain-containing protein [Gordonia asplenii]NMO03780.1 hypothetical protein [Gordonia asplenii]